MAATFVAAGLSSPASAYTLRETEAGAQVHWTEDSVAMRVDPAFAAALGERPAAAAMGVAEGLWASVPLIPAVLIGGSTQLEPGFSMGGENENGIYLLEEWPFDDDRLAVTVSTYAADGTLLDADVLVNGTHPFALVPEGGYVAQSESEIVPYDIASVVTHEIGHVLGLGENEEDAHSVMWPRIRRGDTSQRVLSDDDREGVLAIYEGASLAPSMPAGGCVGGSTIARGSAVSLSAPFAMLALMLGTYALWSRSNKRGVRLRGSSRSVRERSGAGFFFAAAGVALFPSLFMTLGDDARSERTRRIDAAIHANDTPIDLIRTDASARRPRRWGRGDWLVGVEQSVGGERTEN